MRNVTWILVILTFIISVVKFHLGDTTAGVMNLSFSLIGLDIFYLMDPKDEKEEDQDEEVKF